MKCLPLKNSMMCWVLIMVYIPLVKAMVVCNVILVLYLFKCLILKNFFNVFKVLTY